MNRLPLLVRLTDLADPDTQVHSDFLYFTLPDLKNCGCQLISVAGCNLIEHTVCRVDYYFDVVLSHRKQIGLLEPAKELKLGGMKEAASCQGVELFDRRDSLPGL